MRLSTGIILSILSANVFAIENLNDVHSSSLLARRAVMADTDDVFLQKRSGDEGKKKQAKSKYSSASNSGKVGHVYTNPAFEGDFRSDPTLTMALKEDSQTLPLRVIPIQNPTPTMALKRGPQTSLPIPLLKIVGATGGSENVHAEVDSDQRDQALSMVIGGLSLSTH
ncbi:hypothetical protein BASA61_008983 [Batrachochytrium salamandrivorans]|nr:hypothetical protein BASA61_008983 [Batrachochytrium salamandrivorans]